MCFEFDYVVTMDGASAANGAAESFGFGSYYLESRGGQKQVVRLKFGRGVTNTARAAVLRNEAEYRTLIAALRDLVGRIRRAGKSPSAYSLLVHTDSQLVVGQLTHLCLRHRCRQGWQVKAANLRPLVDEAAALIRAFGRCDLVKVPRDEIVQVLGH
jgi:ribonuclease HI